MEYQPKLEVCFSPALLHLFDTKGKNVVIIDIFRATSTITTALANGAASVIPVATVKECIDKGLTMDNSVTAGERDGQIAEGLAYGNSPLSYPTEFIKNKKLILTTTNGTRLLHMVKDAHDIIIGSFLNLSAVCDFLIKQNRDILLGCAAWKDKFNLEDTLFAGAIVHRLKPHVSVLCDSAIAAEQLYISTRDNILEFLKGSNHYRRLSGYGLYEDLAYCTSIDLHPIVPILKNGALVCY